MAENRLKITFTWENNKHFTCKAKRNDEQEITILAMEENGELASLWGDAQSCLMKYFDCQLTAIGNTMKA